MSIRKEEFERVVNIYCGDAGQSIFVDDKIIVFNSNRMLSGFNNSQIFYDENDCRLLLCSILNMYLHIPAEKSNVPQRLVYAMREMKKIENIRAGISAFTKISSSQLNSAS